MKIRILALTAVLASFLAPSVASAAPEYIRCTVKVSGGWSVVVGMTSTNNQASVQGDAAVCGYLISTGNWVAANKYTDWDALFGRQCTVPLDGSASVIVWSGDDTYSELIAQAVCDGVAEGA
jgi:hypothetical protein